MKIRRAYRFLAALLSINLILGIIFVPQAWAYFNRGQVSLSLGATSVTVQEGKKVTVTVSMDPESRTGMQGCGMIECPQECPDDICAGGAGDVVSGECPCAGTAIKTWMAAAQVSSDNTLVAEARYSGGNIIITGLSPGTAEISVTGTLREYTPSDTQTISVTVQEGKSSGGGSSGGGSPIEASTGGKSSNSNYQGLLGKINLDQASPDAGSSGGDTAVNDVPAPNETPVVVLPDDNGSADPAAGTNPSDSQPVNPPANQPENQSENQTPQHEQNEAPGAEGQAPAERKTVINTPRSNFEIIAITPGPTGKDKLAEIKEHDQTVTFEQKGPDGNVRYSWTFKGQDITEPADIDMAINFPDLGQVNKNTAQNLENPLFISFAHHGDLPGKATVYVNTGTKYREGDQLSLYLYDPQKNTLELAAANIPIKAGYAVLEISHCSDYILAQGLNEEAASGFPIAQTALAVLAIVIAGALALIFSRRKQGGAQS